MGRVDESRFWQLIDRARRARASFLVSLREHLAELSNDELFGFQHELERQLALSDRANLAVASCLVFGSWSEARFHGFRAWLVAQGQSAFEAALEDPDSIGELDWERPPELPELSSAARAAWRARTGRDDFLEALPDVEDDEVPFGDDEGVCSHGAPDLARLARRFPRLAAKLASSPSSAPEGRLPPRALTDLRDADAEVRAGARLQLQRSLDCLRAEDVGTLIEQASDPDHAERAFLVRLLSDLCVADSGRWALEGFDVDSPLLEGYFDQAPLLRERYEAVEHALPALLALLSDASAEIRGNAAMCVSWFSRSAERVRAALARALPIEREPLVVAGLLLALALQDRYLHDEASLPLIEANLGEPGPVGVAASLALYGYGDEPAPEALRGIEGLLSGSLDPVAGLPWNDGDLATLGVMALGERLPAEAERVERLFFSLIERADASCPAAAHALPLLLWLVSPRERGAGEPDPRLARLLRVLSDKPALATPRVWHALAALGLPDTVAALAAYDAKTRGAHPLDAALELIGAFGSVERGLASAFEVARAAVGDSAPGTSARARQLAAALSLPAAPAEPTRLLPETARAALLVAAAVLAAEQTGESPPPSLDPLAEALLGATPALVPFFARYLQRLGEERQRSVLDPLAARRFEPRWGRATTFQLEQLLAEVLPALGPGVREQLLERCLDSNWRVVLNLSPRFPSRRVVAALLPRVESSLVDLERWAPEAVPQAVERDAEALARIGNEAKTALCGAPAPAEAAARKLHEAALDKLSRAS